MLPRKTRRPEWGVVLDPLEYEYRAARIESLPQDQGHAAVALELMTKGQ
mgnify:CR=1 FL=1